MLLTLLVVLCPVRAQEHDPGLQDQFLKGVAKTATKLEQMNFRGRFAYSYSAEGEDAFDKNETRTYEVAIRATSGLETGLRKKSGNVFFRARNEDYAFELQRTTEGDRTSLQFVEQIGSDPAVDAKMEAMADRPRAYVFTAFWLWEDPLYRLIESKSFRIDRVYSVTSGGADLVRVEFDYRVNDPSRDLDYHITDGYLVCDPAREWALTEYGGTEHDFITKDTLVRSVVLEYGEMVDGVPIAAKTSMTMDSLERDYKGKIVWTSEIISRDVPEEEFYLTHYGLPEPNFDQGWFGAWAWYLIAGIGCLIVSAMILKRQKAGA